MESRKAHSIQLEDQGVSDTLASLNWNPFRQPAVDEAMRTTDWTKLCQLASHLNNAMSCRLLDKTNAGLNNLVRVLEFADSTRWIVRIPLYFGKCKHLDLDASTKLRSEVHTMQLIRERCRDKLPVPRVFAYQADADNDVGVPFVLMEFLPADTAMDANGGYDVHRGVLPKEVRPRFYHSVAQCHVHLAGLRFSKIGTVIKCAETGEFDIGPLPHIGGPFETASTFFEAWAAWVQFRMDRGEVVRAMPASQPELAGRVADAIERFPAQVGDLFARRPSPRNDGPFPLVHADFLHSNMLVDSESRVVGVIDWEGAQTVPWECVTFPGFLECMPPSFDMPAKYDDDGQPLDEETRDVWEERRQYVQLVRAAECDAAAEGGERDDLLSATLADDNTQALAYAIRAYEDTGKLGFYDQVVRQLWS